MDLRSHSVSAMKDCRFSLYSLALADLKFINEARIWVRSGREEILKERRKLDWKAKKGADRKRSKDGN